MRLRYAVLAVLLSVLAGCGAAAPTPVGALSPVTPAITVTTPIALPVTVAIPALDVTDEIVPVGLNPDRTMQVPDVAEVGWYEPGVAVGAAGPAILAGHVNYQGVAGSFARIGELRPGDTITVSSAEGAQATFAVYAVTSFPKAEFRTELVYGDTAGPELRLVTCSGTVVDHNYLDNTVVSARLLTS